MLGCIFSSQAPQLKYLSALLCISSWVCLIGHMLQIFSLNIQYHSRDGNDKLLTLIPVASSIHSRLDVSA